jgi:anti-sigma-K factor RskA
MAVLPSLAAFCVEAANALASRAWAAFWRTVAVSSSIDAAVSCRCAAWRSLRSDSAPLPAAISLAAVLIDAAHSWMRPTMRANCPAVALASRWMAAKAP